MLFFIKNLYNSNTKTLNIESKMTNNYFNKNKIQLYQINFKNIIFSNNQIMFQISRIIPIILL